MVKSLTNKLSFVRKIYRFKSDHFKELDCNLIAFNKLVQDLYTNTGEKVSEEYEAVILNTISKAYGYVKTLIKYGERTLPWHCH